jgi:ABC-type transport system involved in multi-copper enzyme maturation permease subunit
VLYVEIFVIVGTDGCKTTGLLAVQKDIVYRSYNRHHLLAIRRLRPLLSVMGWELYRYKEMRISRFMIIGISLFFVFGAWSWAYFSSSLPYASTSTLGTALELSSTFTWTLSVMIPFLVAGLVTRDYKQRVHELLMSTSIPTWAYIWGRYLAGLSICLALVVLVLPLVLAMDFTFYTFLPHTVPVPNVGEIVALWGITALPVMLVSGLSFFLCTLLPRQSTLMKILVLTGWLFSWSAGSASAWAVSSGLLSEQVAVWDPTTIALPIKLMIDMYADPRARHLSSTQDAHATQVFRIIVAQQKMPDLLPWLLTHLLYAVLGLVLVALTAIFFKRFRNTLD